MTVYHESIFSRHGDVWTCPFSYFDIDAPPQDFALVSDADHSIVIGEFAFTHYDVDATGQIVRWHYRDARRGLNALIVRGGSQEEAEQSLRRAALLLAPEFRAHFESAHFDASTLMLLSNDGLYGLTFDRRLNDGTVFMFVVGEGG